MAREFKSFSALEMTTRNAHMKGRSKGQESQAATNASGYSEPCLSDRLCMRESGLASRAGVLVLHTAPAEARTLPETSRARSTVTAKWSVFRCMYLTLRYTLVLTAFANTRRTAPFRL